MCQSITWQMAPTLYWDKNKGNGAELITVKRPRYHTMTKMQTQALTLQTGQQPPSLQPGDRHWPHIWITGTDLKPGWWTPISHTGWLIQTSFHNDLQPCRAGWTATDWTPGRQITTLHQDEKSGVKMEDNYILRKTLIQSNTKNRNQWCRHDF